jgi:hypothetical protein
MSDQNGWLRKRHRKSGDIWVLCLATIQAAPKNVGREMLESLIEEAEEQLAEIKRKIIQ